LFRTIADRLAPRFNAGYPITARWLRIHPLIEIIIAIPNQGTKLPESRPALLKPPPAQRRQANFRFLGDLEFGQKDPGHLGTSVAIGFAAHCECAAYPNMNRNVRDVEYDFGRALSALRIIIKNRIALSAYRIIAL
jgi:hypothetical protein